jgi:galactokinase/mevalonate kinase-like predicted kinase
MDSQAMILSSSPGRAGIVGNPTDMYGGSVISCSIGERAYCRLGDSEEMVFRIGSDSMRVTGRDVLTLDEGRFDLMKAAVCALEIDPATAAPFSLEVWTEIPEQAGLAGSTALLAAIMGCLMEHLEMRLTPYQTAENIRKVEWDIMDITCGYQDHYMTVFGGLNYMDFRGKEMMRQDADEPFATIECLSRCKEDLPMILAHTGVKRFSGGVHKSIRDRWLEGEEKVIDAYQRIAHLGRLGKKALLASDWESLADLMNENHAIQRDLGGSGDANERLIEAALRSGAAGAKLAGAGRGGTIIAIGMDLERIEAGLTGAGAEKLLRLKPSDGLTVERMC